MNLTTHLAKTDVRRSRGLLLAWLLILALQGLLACMAPPNPGKERVLTMFSRIMPQLEMLLLFVFVPFVALKDPLVGTTGFWLTRPISRSTLLRSKALFVAVALVLPVVLVEVVVFAVNGVAWRETALVVPEVIMFEFMLIMQFWAIAALTPTFGRYVIAGAAIVVGLLVTELVISWMQMSSGRQIQSFSLARSCLVMMNAWIIIGGGAVVANQYLTRKTVRSIVGAAVVGVAAVWILNFWTWDFLAPALPDSALPVDVSAVKIELQGRLFSQEIMSTSGLGAPEKQMNAVMDAEGIPWSYPLRPKRIRAHLQLPDGTVLPVKEAASGVLMMQMHEEALEFGVGGIPVVNAEDPKFSIPLFVLDAETYSKYQDQPLTLSADIDCVAQKYAITAELPVAKGARSDHGTRSLKITGVLQQSDGVDIMVRERLPNLIFDRANGARPEFNSGPGSRFYYVLRNKKRNEAVVQKRSGSGVNFYAPFGDSRLINRSSILSFGPEPQNNRLTPALNAEWLADAELVRLDLEPLKEFSARLVVENFKLNGKGGTKSLPARTEPKQAQLPRIVLPENATKEQVKEYINAVLITGQRRKEFKADDPQVGMLVKVGPQNLDALIEVKCTLGSRHTLDWHGGDALSVYLDAAIKQLVRPEDKELVIRALPFDEELADIILEKGFAADARETLLAGLSGKNNSLRISWIEAVASLRDPATYPALKAYFVRCDNRQSTFAVIRNLPGIELANDVDEAWKKAKYNEREATYMCGIAAEFGHADALETAANILRSADRDEYRQEARAALTKFTSATGDDAALLAWSDANQAKLVFDPQRKKFDVKP